MYICNRNACTVRRRVNNHFLGGGSPMPLARIFTRNPEGTADLSGQLRQQGYTVEVARPDQTNLAPADLEIEFEVCERADVLNRAADLAAELDADVAVSPGVLKPAVQPSPEPAIRLQPVPEPVTENVVELKSQPAIADERERAFEAAFAPVIEMPAAMQAGPEVVDVPVMEHEPMPPVAFLDEPAAPQHVASPEMPERYPGPVVFHEPAVFHEAVHEARGAEARGADPMPYLAQLTPFSTPATRGEEQPQAANGAKEPSQIQLRGKKVLQDGAKAAAQAWASALALASSTTASVRDHFEEYKKRAQVRSAEARAQHAARLLDLEQRRAEAQQRATELEAAREAAAARLLELVRQRDPGLPKESLPKESFPKESLPKESLASERLPQQDWRGATPVERRAPTQRQPSQSMYDRMPNNEDRRREAPVARQMQEPVRKGVRSANPIELWRGLNPQLRPVLAGAAVTALFIGLGLGLFHSRAPLANPANHASNGVTVTTGGVTLQAGAAKPQPAQPVSAQPAQAKPQPSHSANAPASTSASKPSPRVRQARLAAQQSEQEIGDDVVVRHYSRPVPTQKPKQTGQQAGLKQFSDLDN
jgi:hypothetical protein